MRITKTHLDEAADMMSRHTGRTIVVKPFPAPRGGWNLVELTPHGEQVLKGGRPARELHDYIHAYTEGYRAAKEKP
jgi:hypothetical protein